MINNLMNYLKNKIRIKGSNQLLIDSAARVRGCSIFIKGQNNRLIVESGVRIRGVQLEIVGTNNLIQIKKDSIIGHGCYLSCKEEANSLIIGEKCMFSRNVKMMTSDGHPIYSQDGERINPAKSIKIGNHVWLADSVTILKGVAIGDGSIVGIHSVVTKNVSPSSVCVGNPAREIAKDVCWSD